MAEKKRALKTGLGYEVEQKQEQNYDREEADGIPANVINWLNAVTEGEHDKIPNTDWKSFNTHIRDGVMICKALNKLLKADGKSAIQFQKKVMSPFVAMTNIENFNAGCVTYGVSGDTKFDSGDLWEVRKGPFYNVLTMLHALGNTANTKSFQPKYA